MKQKNDTSPKPNTTNIDKRIRGEVLITEEGYTVIGYSVEALREVFPDISAGDFFESWDQYIKD